LDLEITPSLGWTWRKWRASIIEFAEDWYVLCFSYKWLGERKVYNRALPDYPSYHKDKTNDYDLVKDLHTLLDNADYVITHNGDRFDLRKANARFVYHRLLPPKKYKSIDTLKISRKYFGFSSNSLDDLAQHLKLGKKHQHDGFDTWKGCMDGNPTAWRKMVAYNNHDVRLLERIYLRLRGYHATHPDMTPPMNEVRYVCPTCLSPKIEQVGWKVGKRTTKRQFQCKHCGHNFCDR
jgi:hypothetical protein